MLLTFRKNLLPPLSVLKIKSDGAKWSMMQESEERSTGCEPMGTAGQGERGKELLVKAHEMKKSKK